jgi:glycosyltransferase involved in cell wall biosynthesis
MSGNGLRVVYLVSTLRRAGPTVQLLNLLRHLDPARFEAVVVTLSTEAADSMLPAYQALGVPVRTLALSRPAALLKRRWRRDIERLVGAPLDASSIVHSQGIRGDVIAAKHLVGITRVATARNYPLVDYPLKFGRLPGLWMAHAHLRAFRALPHVVACSSTLGALLRERGIEAAVIPNGVDTAIFRPASTAERAELRSRLGLPAASRIGVSVGALSPRKDPLAIVRAIRAIDDPALCVIFVGDGPLSEVCRQAAAGDRRIWFAGQVGDVTSHLRAADFLVSTSHAEGLPNAVLEAMACGLPAVLTDIGPHSELCDMASAGSCTTVPVGDDAALAAAVVRTARRGLGASVASDPGLMQRLGAERMSKSYQELYLQLAGAKAAA